MEIQTGLEFWCTPAASQRLAPRYKQFLVTLSVIYPLTILIPLVATPVFNTIHFLGVSYVKQLMVDAIIVALIAYVIMARYTRAIAN